VTRPPPTTAVRRVPTAEAVRRVPTAGLARRVPTALRYMLMTGVLVGAVGVAGRFLAWPLLTSTVGPTAYVFAAHPRTATARFRNAAVGHGVAIGAGVGSLAAFGLLRHPSVSATGAPALSQVGAAALAAAVTMLCLELAGSHHAPAAATALLIATGLARPGAPLIGLVLGLAIVVAVGPLMGRIPVARPVPEVVDVTGTGP
ncbi:MAG: HPP family protein, partial [Acidimicrobiales bacterium]